MAIIDSTMAGYMLNTDAYSDLSIITLSDAPESLEEYGVAAKSGNVQLIDEVNKRMAQAYNGETDITYAQVAADYGLTSEVFLSLHCLCHKVPPEGDTVKETGRLT